MLARSSGQVTFIWVQIDYGIREVYLYSPDVGGYNVMLLPDLINSNSYQSIASSNGYTIKSQEATITIINEPSKNELHIINQNTSLYVGYQVKGHSPICSGS